ncbi:MAG: hypothetical protein KDD69_19510, partial [Bdellovibrionales bacterium]|nr:hypothetical protein [Bdellovibrionales bacterium]
MVSLRRPFPYYERGAVARQQILIESMSAKAKQSPLQSTPDPEQAVGGMLWHDRMEAAARLAGSVAHDFNNLLTAISGYAELLQRNLSADDPNRRAADSIKRASDAAHVLTDQLLSFSKRQIVRAQVCDLQVVLANAVRTLEVLCGEQVTWEILSDGTPISVKVDESQIQQVVLNLGL